MFTELWPTATPGHPHVFVAKASASGIQEPTANIADATTRGLQPAASATTAAAVAALIASGTARALQPSASQGATRQLVTELWPFHVPGHRHSFSAKSPVAAQTVSALIADATARGLQPIGLGSGAVTPTILIASSTTRALQPGTALGASSQAAEIARILTRALQPVGGVAGAAPVTATIASIQARALQPTTGMVVSVSTEIARGTLRAIQPAGSVTGAALIATNIASLLTRALQTGATGGGAMAKTTNIASLTSRALQPLGEGRKAVQYGRGMIVRYSEAPPASGSAVHDFTAVICEVRASGNVDLFIFDPNGVIAAAAYFARSDVEFSGTAAETKWTTLWTEGGTAVNQWLGQDDTT